MRKSAKHGNAAAEDLPLRCSDPGGEGSRSVTPKTIEGPCATRVGNANPFQSLADEVALRGLGPRQPSGVVISSVKDLGRLVRRNRHYAATSQVELAAKAGVGRRVVGEIEAGKETARSAELFRVCEAIGLVLSARPSSFCDRKERSGNPPRSQSVKIIAGYEDRDME